MFTRIMKVSTEAAEEEVVAIVRTIPSDLEMLVRLEVELEVPLEVQLEARRDLGLDRGHAVSLEAEVVQ